MSADTPRWRERRGEFARTVTLLVHAGALRKERALTQVEEAGMVQFFNLAVELGWKTMVLYLRDQGVMVASAPLPAIREAMRAGLIEDGDGWAAAVEQRNRMAQVYDPDAFGRLVADISAHVVALFEKLLSRLQ